MKEVPQVMLGQHAQALIDSGITALPGPIDEKVIFNSHNAWLELCALNQERKEKLLLDSLPDGLTAGYALKQQSEGFKGNQEFFIYRYGIAQKFIQKIESPPKELIQLLHYSDHLYEQSLLTIWRLVVDLEKTIPGISPYFRQIRTSYFPLLRYEHYFPQPEANPQKLESYAVHSDPSALTMHICETRGSLLIGNKPGTSNELFKRTPNTLPVIAGDLIEDVTQGKIKRLYHQVIDPEPMYHRSAITFQHYPLQ